MKAQSTVFSKARSKLPSQESPFMFLALAGIVMTMTFSAWNAIDGHKTPFTWVKRFSQTSRITSTRFNSFWLIANSMTHSSEEDY
ncbi:hypothetical protein FR932_12185 [Moritella marina ATCC 15381]|uniref:Uncharacterized protein n=1 Tax=Moritella marina ATCC 15381 TaxID=1202962 RepID=A0A5J6WNT2_MORMI|nr:hypothetical protein [Moritella marina]QFI38555.1 hypothetical protein FR932_12185 [Moritella marina ATCC 15381]